MTTCFVCGKEKNLKFTNIGKYLIPTSKKPIITVLKQLASFIKNGLKISSDECLCKMCFNELVQYDDLVTELVRMQRRLIRMIAKSQFSEDQDAQELYKGINLASIKEELNDVVLDEMQEINVKNGIENFDDAFKEEEIVINDCSRREPIDEDQLEIALGSINDNIEQECKEEDEATNTNLPASKKVTCSLCTKKFTNQARLEYHVAKAHKPQEQSTCSVCGLTLRDEEYLELHMNIHEGKTEKECRYCLKQYTRKKSVIRHMQLHWNKKKFQCEKCGLRFSQSTVLYNHKLQHEAEEIPLICEICNQTFKTKRTYKGHMMTHRDDRPRFTCPYCSKTFVEKYTLKVHLRTHEGDDSMKKTNVKIKQKNEIPMGDEMSNLSTCIICGCSFTSRDQYNQHMENEHDVILSREKSQIS